MTRTVRSYVLRQGRLTGGQRRALEQHWDRYGIEYSPAPLDLDARFGRRAPKVLDIGSGMGAATVALAAAHPENDYLAIEVHRPGVGSLIRLAREQGAGNLRVICHDAVDVIRHQLADRSLDEVYVLYPDPWPKKRHHKRRLVNDDFIRELAPRLKRHGRIYLATDWEHLALHMLAVCDRSPLLINLAGPGQFAPRPAWRPPTRFELRGERLAHAAWDLVYAVA